MSSLFFRYGAMNSGKSTALLQVAHNYEERDQTVLLLKPQIDVKGQGMIVSRPGVSRKTDLLVDDSRNIREAVHDWIAAKQDPEFQLACVLIDEAQFLTPEQVDQALEIAVYDAIPVLAYGIRTDFRTKAVPGSLRLMEVAHKLEELKTICRCGRKAIFNGRYTDKGFAVDGAQVMIDEIDAHYEAMCGACFLSQRDAAQQSPQ